jgi:hypothetical protein
MEGARMIDEWPIIERRIRSFDLVVRRRATDPGGTAASTEPVSVYETDIDFGLMNAADEKPADEAAAMNEEETLVYGLVDGRSTVQDIIDRCHLGEFETCRILYELMSRDLVEEGIGDLSRAEAPAAPPGRSFLLRGATVAMGVLALISLLLSLRSPLSPLGTGGIDPFAVNRIRIHLSQARVGRIDQALRIYHLERQTLPLSLDVLVRDGFLRQRDLLDPWGHPYGYDIDPSGYAITGCDSSGQPDRSVSIQSQFAASQRLALEGGVSAQPIRR